MSQKLQRGKIKHNYNTYEKKEHNEKNKRTTSSKIALKL